MPPHGTKQHRLYEKDVRNRTAVCRVCGPTSIGSNSRGGWRCVQSTTLTRQAERVWRDGNPASISLIEFRRRLGHYSLTPETYFKMLDDQGGHCATCDRTEPGGRGRWHIDHDHRCCPAGVSCGACVRGLLCSACNRALGLVRDDPRTLIRMAEYLSKR